MGHTSGTEGIYACGDTNDGAIASYVSLKQEKFSSIGREATKACLVVVHYGSVRNLRARGFEFDRYKQKPNHKGAADPFPGWSDKRDYVPYDRRIRDY